MLDPRSIYGVATLRMACPEIILAVMAAKRRPYGGLTAAGKGRRRGGWTGGMGDTGRPGKR